MKAWILSVGDEVLSGKTVNTNASFLAQELECLGIEVKKSLVVSDDESQIQEAVSWFMESDAKVLITTGGLGPTHDDITKEAIAKSLGKPLVFSQEAADDMKAYFKEEKKDVNLKQTWIPEGATLIHNKIGSADGLILETEGKIVILLVGPPYENQPMIEDTVIPYLRAYAEPMLLQDYITMGNSESYFEGILQEVFLLHPEVTVSPYADNGRVRFRVLAKSIHQKEFEEVKRDFEQVMKDYIISKANESIEEVVVKALVKRNYTISFAESCTGGMLASMITSVPGASSVLNESLVTYSESAKTKYLNIRQELIESCGVVSPEVARAMVEGLYEITQSDVCVSITGYAGPTGEDVGKMCYAIKIKDKILSEERRFRGNREMIRTRVARYLLYLVYRHLE